MTDQEEIRALKRNLAAFAQLFVGVKEVGGNNQGEFVRMFQRAVDGKAQGESWCSCYASYCIKASSLLFSKAFEKPDLRNSYKLKLSESVMNVWTSSSSDYRLEKPEVGCLILWRRWAAGEPTWMGHIEIVTEILSEKTVQTVGGNTSSDDPNSRDGDGVYLKKRDITKNYGSLRPLGFLRVF